MKGTKKSRRKYSDEQIREYISRFKASGMNRSRFAKENRINYFTFIGWLDGRSHFKKSKRDEKFIPVSIPQRDPVFAEMQLENGKRICFYQALSPQYLRELLLG